MFKIILALIIFGGMLAVSVMGFLKSNKEAQSNDASSSHPQSAPGYRRPTA